MIATWAKACNTRFVQHDFNTQILEETTHRPWPMPDRAWIMTQTWNDLLFAHWPVDVGLLAPKIPPHFELDLFGGTAWLGVVPFHMTNVAPRYVPALPWISAFPELNVRTYVRARGKPGVFFFSLDAANPLAVKAARSWLNLPYFTASMNVEPTGRSIRYHSRRKGLRGIGEFVAEYEPDGQSFQAREGSLEYFLTERYCLYAIDRKARAYRLEIHHPPWRLQSADGWFERNSMAEASGIRLPDSKPLLHFAKRQDMVGWAPEMLNAEC